MSEVIADKACARCGVQLSVFDKKWEPTQQYLCVQCKAGYVMRIRDFLERD